MIYLQDIYGKTWKFTEKDITEIYFDNSYPNDWIIVIVGQAKIKAYRWVFASTFPHITEDMPLRI